VFGVRSWLSLLGNLRMRLPRRVPWASTTELSQLCSWIFADESDHAAKSLAVDRVSPNQPCSNTVCSPSFLVISLACHHSPPTRSGIDPRPPHDNIARRPAAAALYVLVFTPTTQLCCMHHSSRQRSRRPFAIGSLCPLDRIHSCTIGTPGMAGGTTTRCHARGLA
jgi:hypothetical protein